MTPTSPTAASTSWYIPLDKTKLTLRDIALFGILGALTFGAKVAMSFLPNIEPTSLLVMVYVVVFGRKALYPIYLYVALEILFYGIQLWNINYLYVWLILALGAMQLICIGIIGEYVGRTFEQSKGRPICLVKEKLGCDE